MPPMTNCDLATATRALNQYRHLNRRPDLQVLIGPADAGKMLGFVRCLIERSPQLCRQSSAPQGPERR